MNADTAVALTVAAAFALLGFLFLSGRGARLVAGYNTLPQQERDRYDERALCRFMGRLMCYFAGCCVLIGGDGLWPGKGLALAGGIWLAIGAVFAMIYANTKGRFLKK